MSLQNLKQRFGIIGNSPLLNYSLSVAERVAPTNLSVLITGESGTGKEIFSQIIHQLSPRKHNKFIAVNCGAIPEGTIDSELFGHEKGSFTGAHDKRKGYFETVDAGTIFLDEIGELPLGTQARLLRVLEAGEFIKVGASEVLKTDVRVVAATNVNLLENIKKGKFREDLYYRLSTVPIEIPPLRERGEDIQILFRKFASDFAEKNRMETVRLTPDAQKILSNYDWPGNIRQLKNIAEQLSVLSTNSEVSDVELLRIMPNAQKRNLPKLLDDYQNPTIENLTEREILYKIMFDLKKDVYDLKQFVFQLAKSGNVNPEKLKDLEDDDNEYASIFSENIKTSSIMNRSDNMAHQPVILGANDEFSETEEVEDSNSISDMEKQMILKSLKKFGGKRKDAANELGISERTLYRKIKEYKIDI